MGRTGPIQAEGRTECGGRVDSGHWTDRRDGRTEKEAGARLTVGRNYRLTDVKLKMGGWNNLTDVKVIMANGTV